jgi:hypothetical protein
MQPIDETKLTERRAVAHWWLLALAVLATGACGNSASEPSDGNASTDDPPVTSKSAADASVAAPSSGTADAGSRTRPTATDAGASRPSAASSDAAISSNPATATDASAAVGSDSGVSDAASPSDVGASSPCMGGTAGKDSASANTPKLDVSREYGALKYLAASGVEIVSLKTTMAVPIVPTQKQTLFIWPALQSRGAADPARVSNGILQPVLTWGGSCNPKVPSASEYYSQWWIAGMYVNVSSAVAGPTGCAGGDYMLTNVGDVLDIEISKKGTNWIQTIVNTTTMKTVDFTIDLKGQVQNWATWAVEVPTGETIAPAADTVFTQSVLTFSAPVTSCQPSQAGAQDFFSAPMRSTDGLHCCYDKIILRKH